jgi:hypothetical protein
VRKPAVTNESAIARRTFLAQAAALGAAGAGILTIPAASAADHRKSTAAEFAPFVGTTFRVQRPKGKFVDLILTAVAPPRVPPGELPKGMRVPFSLVFRGPRTSLPQRTYVVEHPRFGTFELFLVPVDMPNLGHYEAAFG